MPRSGGWRTNMKGGLQQKREILDFIDLRALANCGGDTHARRTLHCADGVGCAHI
jgi:hypothetical protein